jgi:hypothetical protein
VGKKAQALTMTSDGNDLSSAVTVLFSLKKKKLLKEDVQYLMGIPLAHNQLRTEGREMMVTNNKCRRGESSDRNVRARSSYGWRLSCTCSRVYKFSARAMERDV